MGAHERPCKPRHSGPKEQSNLKITSLSKLTKNTIKKSGSEKISSVARQSTGRKWTLQEEIRLLALFVAVGPDWPKISEYFEDRQPSTIKCKLNNMLRYALVGTNDRVDDVGRFTKRIANEIKSKSCTLFQYHSQYLSKLPLTKMEPLSAKNSTPYCHNWSYKRKRRALTITWQPIRTNRRLCARVSHQLRLYNNSSQFQRWIIVIFRYPRGSILPGSIACSRVLHLAPNQSHSGSRSPMTHDVCPSLH